MAGSRRLGEASTCVGKGRELLRHGSRGLVARGSQQMEVLEVEPDGEAGAAGSRLSSPPRSLLAGLQRARATRSPGAAGRSAARRWSCSSSTSSRRTTCCARTDRSTPSATPTSRSSPRSPPGSRTAHTVYDSTFKAVPAILDGRAPEGADRGGRPQPQAERLPSDGPARLRGLQGRVRLGACARRTSARARRTRRPGVLRPARGRRAAGALPPLGRGDPQARRGRASTSSTR